jgi:aminoglycoside phosphotransferase (APT) family kinase protein
MSGQSTAFVLTPDTAQTYVREYGLAPVETRVQVEELAGGVSSSVIAIRGSDVGLVLKQALPKLRVEDEWLAKVERTDTEASALLVYAGLTPRAVPRLIHHDRANHLLVMELAPSDRRNWQVEISQSRPHLDAAEWAGETLGTWHRETTDRAAVAGQFDDHEAFAQLRLDPFHATVAERRPELAELVLPCLDELRQDRRCLVHGDYAKKNMLIGPSGRWVIDHEVAHFGNPVFDIAFFLSFVVLSAVRWERLRADMRRLGDTFLDAYHANTGAGFAGDAAAIAAHTACLILARTDGKSPAPFLGEARDHARHIGIGILRAPECGLWDWLSQDRNGTQTRERQVT